MARRSFVVGTTLLVAVVAGLLPLVMAYNNGVARLPPMGWNTWCTDDICGLIDKCSADLVVSQGAAMVSSGMRALGYNYLIMDDCWSAKTRDANGHLQADANRFPNGMAHLVKQVHAMGLKIGAYTCVGTETCRNGLPGSFDHYEDDADTMARWEMDLIKADNCNRPGGFTERELYTNYSKAINKTGRPILFAMCEWGDEDVLAWGGKLGQQFRVQMDHLPAWYLPTHGAGKGNGQGTWNIIEYVATIKPSSFVRPYAWMDPGVLMTLFPTFTYRQSRVEFSFWSLWSAPLVVATQISNMTEEKRSILLNADVIKVNQDPLAIAGDRLFNHSDGGQLWARPLSNGDAALIFYNNYLVDLGWNATVTADWQALGIATGSTWVNMFDLWTKTWMNVSATVPYSVSLTASDATMVRITCSHPPCIRKMELLNRNL